MSNQKNMPQWQNWIIDTKILNVKYFFFSRSTIYASDDADVLIVKTTVESAVNNQLVLHGKAWTNGIIWHASSLSVDVVRISHIFIVVELVLIDLNIHIYRLNRDQNGKEKVLTNQYLCHEEPMDCW
jgi:hypothetical protein